LTAGSKADKKATRMAGQSVKSADYLAAMRDNPMAEKSVA
jgi:hypothetical protein